MVEEYRAGFRHTDMACRGRKGQGACRIGICKTLVHTRLFVDAKIHFFGIHEKPLEVPLNAARLAGMTCHIRGKRGKRWAAEMMSLATERFPRPPIFSLSLIRRRASFRRERSERAEPPPRKRSLLGERHFPAKAREREPVVPEARHPNNPTRNGVPCGVADAAWGRRAEGTLLFLLAVSSE